MTPQPQNKHSQESSQRPSSHARSRWLFTVAALVTLLAAWGVTSLQMDTSLDVLFSRSDPAARAMGIITRDFPVTDSLVLVVGLDDDADDPARINERAQSLRDFGDELTAAALADESLQGMLASISHTASPDAHAFAQEVMLPRLPEYLNNDQRARLSARLSREGMDEALSCTQALLASPAAGGVMARELARDPLMLRDFALELMQSLQPPMNIHRAADDTSPAIINHNATRMLITMLGTKPVSDMQFSADLVAHMKRVTAGVNAKHDDRFTLRWTGGYAIADHAQRAIRHDMIVSTITSLVLIHLLFLVVFRHPLYFLLAAGPVAMGIFWGFGVYALTGSGLTPPVAVIGGMLAGLGIDYALHVLAHDKPGSRLPWRVVRAMLGALLTTLTAFGVLLISSMPAMRQFGLLGMLGLAGSFIACMLILPAMLAWLRSRKWSLTIGAANLTRTRMSMHGAVKCVEHRPRIVLGAGGLVAIVFVGMIFVHSTGDETVVSLRTIQHDMHPQPNAPLETQAMIERSFGLPPQVLMVLVEANSPQALVTLSGQVKAALLDLPEEAHVMHVASVSDFFPAAVQTDEQLDPAKVLGDFDDALAASNFNPAAFAAYRATLAHMLQPGERLTLPQAAARWPGMFETMLPRGSASSLTGESARHSHRALMYVWLNQSLADSATRILTLRVLSVASASSGQLGQATLTGTAVLASHTQIMVLSEIVTLGLIAAAVVLLMLAILLRSIRQVLIALLPLAGSILFMLAWMNLSGQSLNLINLISLPLILGIAVDYGIFLVTAEPASDDDASLRIFSDNVHASTLCCVTTIIGFGSIITVSMPALASLGWLLVVGMSGAMAGAWLVAIPWLLMHRKKSSGVAMTSTEAAQ